MIKGVFGGFMEFKLVFRGVSEVFMCFLGGFRASEEIQGIHGFLVVVLGNSSGFRKLRELHRVSRKF